MQHLYMSFKMKGNLRSKLQIATLSARLSENENMAYLLEVVGFNSTLLMIKHDVCF